MELKDVILSTLAEMEESESSKKVLNSSMKPKVIQKREKIEITQSAQVPLVKEVVIPLSNSEMQFLNSLRERLLVLFEGFQAPNNTNIEAKVDMTLNFLEYALATIDERAQQLEKGRLK